MLNIFPKLELVPNQKVFGDVAEAFLPSTIPLWSTRSPGSTRMMSAASRAISTAVERRSHVRGAQRRGVVDPIPDKATTWPRALSASRMRVF